MDTGGGRVAPLAEHRQAGHEDQPEQPGDAGQTGDGVQVEVLLIFDDHQLGELGLGDPHGQHQGLLVLHGLGDGAGDDAVFEGVVQIGLDALQEIAAVEAGTAVHALGQGHGEGHGVHGILKARQQRQVQHQGPVFTLGLLILVAHHGGDGIAEGQGIGAGDTVEMGQRHQIHAVVDPAGAGLHRFAVEHHVVCALGQGEGQTLLGLFQGDTDRQRHMGAAVLEDGGGILDCIRPVVGKYGSRQQCAAQEQQEYSAHDDPSFRFFSILLIKSF